jgi:rubrerythrin
MDSKKRVEEGIKKAIEAEGTGYHFYMMASSKTEDTKGKKIFEALANEELEHVRFLRAQLASLTETGNVNSAIELSAPKVDEAGASPIFSAELKSRIGDAHYEMTALSIGIQLELSSMNFYKEEAEAAEDPDVATMYRSLMDWEGGHYDMLKRQQDNLREDYWAEGGFNPF